MKNGITTLQKSVNQLFQRRLFLILIALGGTLFLSELCSVSLFCNGRPGIDSSVFRYAAYAMSKGQLPYRDFFDHKGPLIYLLNYAGYMIHPNKGLWIIEFASMFTTVIFLFKIAKLICKNHILCVLSTIFSLSLLPQFFEGGNLTEEFAMPLIAIAIFIFADYGLHVRISIPRLLTCGICGGCVLMLRPNMAVAWLVFPLFVCINELRSKQFMQLLSFSLFFLLGVFLAIAPFLIFFAATGTLKDFFDAYILFNLQYSGDGSITAILKSAYYFVSPLIYLVGVTLFLSLLERKRRLFHISYLLFIALSLLSIGMTGFTYDHYGMILIPLLAYPLGLLLSNFKSGAFANAALCALTLTVFMTAWLYPSLAFARHIVSNRDDFNEPQFQEVVAYVTSHTPADEPIQVVGSRNLFYLKCDRLSASRYSYQWPIASVREDIYTEFYSQLEQNTPAVIIVPQKYADFSGLSEFTKEHDYKEVLNNEAFTVYQHMETH